MDRISNPVSRLDFVRSPDRADAMTKAVLGIFTTALDEQAARRFAKALPDPLTYDRLRSPRQKDARRISADDFVSEICAQFNIAQDQGRKLVREVLGRTRDEVGGDVFNDALSQLPGDWKGLVR